ncbi:glycosyltransferase family 2 protein [Marivita geojedonensis]|uniref:Family 2 glycosyl transferase n=1 Tax=Marivita geojedonensis TaxID=1123756 RepID=A0A1X4NRD0_9RHOB|nr:glycosyltransferase family 2 protein [Marivita geojedonensis]OSQ53499.1 family 2 glycosyl transferase [Marivita geojedonensis]PRY81497.1 glycosyltransferase [Marivita geojedonensis]
MKISVVTAVYNRRATIAQALGSVSSQNYAQVEHVIQDGGSTDGTVDLIAEISNDRMRLTSEPDDGIYDAINRGIRRAQGDVIGLMHSDDLFAHTDVLTAVAEALSNPDLDGVYGDLDYVAADDTSRIIRRWRSGPYSQDRLSKGWMPPHPTVYLRRDVFDRYGLYDTSYRIAADYDAMLRYLGKGQIKLGYIPDVMVKMRVGGESNKSLGKILRKSREDYRAIRSNGVGGLGTLARKNLSKIQQFF